MHDDTKDPVHVSAFLIDPRQVRPGDIVTFMDGDGLERILVKASIIRDDGVPVIGGIPCDEQGRLTAMSAQARTCVQSQVLLINGRHFSSVGEPSETS